jgi:hypothetical protein
VLHSWLMDRSSPPCKKGPRNLLRLEVKKRRLDHRQKDGSLQFLKRQIDLQIIKEMSSPCVFRIAVLVLPSDGILYYEY